MFASTVDSTDDFGDTARDSVAGGEGPPSTAVCVSSEEIMLMELKLDNGVDVVEVDSMSKAVLLGKQSHLGVHVYKMHHFPGRTGLKATGLCWVGAIVKLSRIE